MTILLSAVRNQAAKIRASAAGSSSSGAFQVETIAMLAFEVGTSQLLLVFLRGEFDKDHEIYGGVIPGHRADGPAHIALHLSIRDLNVWRTHFERCAVPITGEITFPAGGRSLYFDDPSGNVLELATPGQWSNF